MMFLIFFCLWKTERKKTSLISITLQQLSKFKYKHGKMFATQLLLLT